jgi:type II secretory pathway pseudopilin PulG
MPHKAGSTRRAAKQAEQEQYLKTSNSAIAQLAVQKRKKPQSSRWPTLNENKLGLA